MKTHASTALPCQGVSANPTRGVGFSVGAGVQAGAVAWKADDAAPSHAYISGEYPRSACVSGEGDPVESNTHREEARDDEAEAPGGHSEARGSTGGARRFPALTGFCAGVAGNGSTVAGGNPAAARARLCERVTMEQLAGSAGILRCRTGRGCTGDGRRRSGRGRGGGGDSGSVN
eukprot:2320217-Pleurochrysis_carterae.AAC.1